MINLRYHIVSLTAVFLAIGIGLTLGSTFLDRATVDNLNGQLDSLQTRLEDREERIGELQGDLDREGSRNTALDEQGLGLLSDRLSDVPVVIVSARGVDGDDVQGAVQALAVAGADVQGIWWFTERWRLDDAGEVDDLAQVLGDDSVDPSRLRRVAIDALGGELRARQLAGGAEPAGDGAGEDGAGENGTEGAAPEAPGAGEPTDDGASPEGGPVGDEPAPDQSDDNRSASLVDPLVESGFVEFEAVAGGPESPQLPNATRLVFAAGSPSVPDDLVLEPLLERLTRATDTPVVGVLGSAMAGDGGVSDAVIVVRGDERLRELVSTVDALEGFEGLAAMVLALAEAGDGVVGHYGLDESASRLLPPLGGP